MEHVLEKPLDGFWCKIRRSLDLTLQELKSFYKDSLSGNVYSFVVEDRHVLVRGTNDNKQLTLELIKVFSDVDLGKMYIQFLNVPSPTRYNDVMFISKGANPCNLKLTLPATLWNQQGCAIDWTTSLDGLTPDTTPLKFVFRLTEQGI